MKTTGDGRMFQPALAALVREPATGAGDGRVEICAPAVGLWRGGPQPGALVMPGVSLGEIEVLGVLHRLEAPAAAQGIVSAAGRLATPARESARQPVAYGQCLLVLEPWQPGELGSPTMPGSRLGAGGDPGRDRGAPKSAAPVGLVFCSPMSGRYYSRPAPDKPLFVQVGDEIRTGATVCLLEVMKTFNRVTYGGDGLPERARIKAIGPGDEDDLEAGDIILHLE